MTRTVLLIAALTVALPTVGAEQAPGTTQSSKERSKRRKGATAPRPSSGAPRAADPQTREAAARARYLFMSRVDLCAPPQRCDADTRSVIDDAGERYMAACRACADDKRCDDDRERIRSGTAARSFDPCDATGP